ncbi:unnamed protein product [Paramecium pentaurelia]|uniref:Tetratricopeptide repeat protein n=1 Tax=Paramecium pentaurelia TaxID=43138 RepID=A0A8S1V024_9CILI|nr:unnamed protein product [Paramecium pentaurelia]
MFEQLDWVSFGVQYMSIKIQLKLIQHMIYHIKKQMISQEIQNLINKQRNFMINAFQYIQIIQTLNLGKFQQNILFRRIFINFEIVFGLRETYQFNETLQYYVKAIEIDKSKLEQYMSQGECLVNLSKISRSIRCL